MAACGTCGREYAPGARGWHARLTGLGPGGRGEGKLARVLICADDFAKMPVAQRMAWHEYTGQTEGATREKRIGRLGDT